MNKRLNIALLCLFALLVTASATASAISGMITVKRGPGRNVIGAAIETDKRDSAGRPVMYEIVMDENGQAIASQYEFQNVRVEGSINGRKITAQTWSSIEDRSSQSSYKEPDPEPEPAEETEEVEEEESEEPSDEEGDEESGKNKTKQKKTSKRNSDSDDEEEVSDEENSDEESSDEENTDEENTDSEEKETDDEDPDSENDPEEKESDEEENSDDEE